GAVANVAAVPGRDVRLDQVAALELPWARDAVYDLVVDRDANMARVAEVPKRRRFSASLLEYSRRDLVQVARGHARFSLLFDGPNRRRDDLAGLAHDGNLARGLEHD